MYWTEVRWSCAMAAVPSGAAGGGGELSAAVVGGGGAEAASFVGGGGESSALGGAGRAVGGGMRVCAKARRPVCERPDFSQSVTVQSFLPFARRRLPHNPGGENAKKDSRTTDSIPSTIFSLASS